MTTVEFDVHIKIELAALDFMQAFGMSGILLAATPVVIDMCTISAMDPPFKLQMSGDGHIHILPNKSRNCSCITHPSICSSPGRFYALDFFNQTAASLHMVSGIILGCTAHQSTMQSILECWYPTECYEQV